MSPKKGRRDAAQNQLFWTALVAAVMGWVALKHYSSPQIELASSGLSIGAARSISSLITSK